MKATKLDKTDKLPENAAENAEQPKKTRKYVKKSLAPEPIAPPCFVCGKKNSNVTCNNKFCNKGYHLKCLELTEMPDGKFILNLDGDFIWFPEFFQLLSTLALVTTAKFVLTEPSDLVLNVQTRFVLHILTETSDTMNC